MEIVEDAAEQALVRRVRRAIAGLGRARVEQSYWTTFWMPAGAPPACSVEELVQQLWARARPDGAVGAEWWIGRSYTTRIPVGFHFDEDVKSSTRFRHPLLSSVFFFNRVRGGQLAITDQRPDARGLARAGHPAAGRGARAQPLRDLPGRPLPRRARRARPHAHAAAPRASGPPARDAGGELLGPAADRGAFGESRALRALAR